MSRLRVLTVGHPYCVAANRGLAREVAKDPDFEVTVAAPSFFYGDLRRIFLEPEPAGSPLRLVPLKTRFSRFIHVFHYDHAALKALIRNGGFDIIHAWEEPYVLAGYQIAKASADSPARFCFRTDQNQVKRYPPPFNRFERTVLKRSQAWIAGASLVYQAMLDKGFPKSSGRIVNYSVDLDDFQPMPAQARAPLLDELGLEPPVIGFMGRLTPAKGLDVLMQAMERIGGARPWSLLFLGSGEYENKVREWAARHGWSKRVQVKLVKHSEVPPYLAAMDVLVAPSQTVKNWKEQFGRMIIEAFACGVPVIGSDSGEIPFVIGDAGRVVAEADVPAWAEAIQQLLDSPASRDELRDRGLARAPLYSVAAIAKQWADCYRWLAGQSLQPEAGQYAGQIRSSIGKYETKGH
jgi:glycosyltransferase involved in cell wall biosynthesis